MRTFLVALAITAITALAACDKKGSAEQKPDGTATGGSSATPAGGASPAGVATTPAGAAVARAGAAAVAAGVTAADRASVAASGAADAARRAGSAAADRANAAGAAALEAGTAALEAGDRAIDRAAAGAAAAADRAADVSAVAADRARAAAAAAAGAGTSGSRAVATSTTPPADFPVKLPAGARGTFTDGSAQGWRTRSAVFGYQGAGTELAAACEKVMADRGLHADTKKLSLRDSDLITIKAEQSDLEVRALITTARSGATQATLVWRERAP